MMLKTKCEREQLLAELDQLVSENQDLTHWGREVSARHARIVEIRARLAELDIGEILEIQAIQDT
jgi:hypothetical protein